MSDDIRTHRELWGHAPKVGYEWDAGFFDARVGMLGGRITVRLTSEKWEVIQVTFLLDHKTRKRVLQAFALGDNGELAAKTYALKVYAERSKAA